jgi:hypothetical protein
MATPLRPCDAEPHAGLALGHEALARVLGGVGAAWVARLACRAMRDAVRARPSLPATAVTSPERCRVALGLGLDRDAARQAAANGRHLETLEWVLRLGTHHGCRCLEVLRWMRGCATAGTFASDVVLGRHRQTLTRWASNGHLSPIHWTLATWTRPYSGTSVHVRRVYSDTQMNWVGRCDL